MIRPIDLALTVVACVAVGVAWEGGSGAGSSAGLACVDPEPAASARQAPDPGASGAHELAASLADPARSDEPDGVRVDALGFASLGALWQAIDAERAGAPAAGARAAVDTDSQCAEKTSASHSADRSSERASGSGQSASLDGELTRKHWMWPVNRLIERYGAPSGVELGTLMHLKFARDDDHHDGSCIRFALQDGLVCCVDVR